MGRNYLTGRDGDRINAVLAAAGYNFGLRLRWFEELLRALSLILWHALLAAPLPLTRCRKTFFTADSVAVWNVFVIRLAAICREEVMSQFVFGTVLVAMLSVSFVAISYDEASAQERSTCSQALSHCGKQRVCQRRYEACMQTGCWTVVLVKRCGYEKR